jgi:hypothetical protein
MRWHADETKSVAGPMGGTAGPTSRTDQDTAKENYRLRSDDRDRTPSIVPSSGPTIGTHIIYQMGAGVEGAHDSSEVVVNLRPRGQCRAS